MPFGRDMSMMAAYSVVVIVKLSYDFCSNTHTSFYSVHWIALPLPILNSLAYSIASHFNSVLFFVVELSAMCAFFIQTNFSWLTRLRRRRRR